MWSSWEDLRNFSDDRLSHQNAEATTDRCVGDSGNARKLHSRPRRRNGKQQLYCNASLSDDWRTSGNSTRFYEENSPRDDSGAGRCGANLDGVTGKAGDVQKFKEKIVGR